MGKHEGKKRVSRRDSSSFSPIIFTECNREASTCHAKEKDSKSEANQAYIRV